ncbi:hypothetical protein BH23ACT3_BH23ACT3_03890 [soil metagenome]
MTRSVPRRLVAIGTVAFAAVAPLSLAACSLTADDSFEFIPADEIPSGLDQTTTTTTTTTTTIPTAPMVEPTLPTTTVTSPVQTAPVEVYFVIGLEQLQRQTLQLSFPLEPLQVLAQLEEGPLPDQSSVGLRTALRANLTNGFENTDGVATIDLRGSVLNRTTPRDQNLAIAQLVLTVTRLPGVGQIRFTLDGDPLPIPVPPTFTLSEAGEPLTYSMFAQLLPSPGATTTTTQPSPPVPPTSTSPPPPVSTSTSTPRGPDDDPDTGEPDADDADPDPYAEPGPGPGPGQ